MTENEAIKKLEYVKRNCGLPVQGDTWKPNAETIALDMAIRGLEELQKYRAIGTVEEIEEILQIISEGQDDVDESGISTGLLHTLLEYAEYAKIGTVEECREVVEKRRAEKPLNEKELRNFHEQIYSFRGNCPKCKTEGLMSINMKYCPNCGQKLNWSEDK